jgi:hypothetical protein
MASSPVYYAVDVGTTNNFVANVPGGPTTLSQGITVLLKASNYNTGPSTFNFNGTGPVPIQRPTALSGLGDLTEANIHPGFYILLVYDGTYWVAQSGLAPMEWFYANTSMDVPSSLTTVNWTNVLAQSYEPIFSTSNPSVVNVISGRIATIVVEAFYNGTISVPTSLGVRVVRASDNAPIGGATATFPASGQTAPGIAVDAVAMMVGPKSFYVQIASNPPLNGVIVGLQCLEL